ncbi:MAG TPA: ring-cleaving dioxygenase, partial [Thermomicrobiales bacterium]|nr:ring-cleaving dioxygenase [Thermomicrobiales bacterium]
MEQQLGGLHHVTAVTAHAPENLDFYTRVLGLRLVKKTVNQDDVSAYHLFYGDEVGHAGTEVTFFDWATAAPNRPGRGEVAAVALRVPGRAALDWWAARFDALGVPHGPIEEVEGRATLAFTDPEGQRLALLDDSGAAVPGGTPWERSTVPAEHGIRGLGAVTLTVARLEPTAAVLTDVLGFRPAGEDATADGKGRVALFETGAGGPGAIVAVQARPDQPHARQGRGGVHHVAFRTPNDEEHAAWQRRIAAAGLAITPVIDRYYFKSIYFREPGGVLFEIATDGPGFATDEDAAHLGEHLALPPFLEPYR